MTYDLSKEYDRQRAGARFEHLLSIGAKIELTEKTMRSLAQNRYLHLIIGVMAMETGNTLEYAKEWYFKRLSNADLFVRKVTDQYAGEVEVVRSSKDLTKEQMTLAIERFRKWASEQGVYLPSANEQGLLQEIEMEMGRMEKYL